MDDFESNSKRRLKDEIHFEVGSLEEYSLSSDDSKE